MAPGRPPVEPPRARAVVRAEPEHRVVGHLHLPQAPAQPPHGGVHAGEFAEVVGLLLGGRVGRGVFGGGLVGTVRRGEPDHRQERLAGLCLPADPLQGQVHHGVGGVLLGEHEPLLTVVEDGRAEIERVAVGVPLVEALVARVPRGGVEALRQALARAPGRLRDAAQVPLAEVARGIAGGAHRLGDRHLRQRQVVSPGHAAVAGGAAAGQAARPGGRAHRVGGEEAVEADARRGHGVEFGRLEDGMAVVARVAPALVVGHAENHVRLARRGRVGRRRGDAAAARDGHERDEGGTMHGDSSLQITSRSNASDRR